MGLFSDLGEVVSSASGGGMSTGSPWGAIGAGVLNYIGTQQTNDRSADLAASNNAWSAEQYAKRYQTMTEDLKSAGLNPMLAYSQSPGSAPTAQQVQFQNPMSTAVQGFTDVLGTRAKAMSDVSSANKGYAEADRIEKQTEDISRRLKAGEPEEAVNLIMADTIKSIEAGRSQNAIRAQLMAQANLLDKQGVLVDLDIKAAKAFDNFAREYKQYAPIVDLVKSIFLHRSGGISINK